MTWMTLFNGHEAPVLHPRLSDINIEHIAHALSQINRFNGSACRPYSVAEHSILALHVSRMLGLSVHAQLAVLMHDAQEAYLGDWIYPIKQELGPRAKALELHWEQLINVTFSLTTHKHIYRQDIVRCDRIALATERRDLLPSTQPDGTPLTPWDILAGHEPLSGIDLLAPEVAYAPWHHWRDRFLSEFNDLMDERQSIIHARLGAA